MLKSNEQRARIRVTVNGRAHTVDVPTNMLLQQLLKEKLALTGTKRGCGRGECGACTVLMNDQPVNACLTLAIESDGATVRTIEGQAAGEQLSDLQRAFIRHGAIQCGFCTPGMLLSAEGLLQRTPAPSDAEIVEAIAGNLCRCTGYTPIIDAIREVASSRQRAQAGGSHGA